MNYSAFLGKTALAQSMSPLRKLWRQVDTLGVDNNFVLMGGGIPNPDVFAITSGTLKLRDGTTVDINEADMQKALQYGNTQGHPEILQFMEDLTKQLHDPPTWRNPEHDQTRRQIVTCGSQDGIYKCVEVLIEETDIVIIEEPAYASIISVLQPIGCTVVTVPVDKDGIVTERLAETLARWRPSDDNGPSAGGKLKMLYCTPSGNNPSGARYSLTRKREIYKLAREYNFIIMEDDAYYFLEGQPLPESFLSMDEDGRVLRLETFSKTVSPGLRLGCVTGPSPIVSRILNISAVSSQGGSSMSQVVLVHLLRRWGVSGFLQHCQSVSQFYAQRRNACLRLLEQYLSGHADWSAPSGGMFVWMKLVGIEDSFKFFNERLLPRKLVVVPGGAFYMNQDVATPYIRVSYSMATPDEMEKAFKIIAEELAADSGSTKL